MRLWTIHIHRCQVHGGWRCALMSLYYGGEQFTEVEVEHEGFGTSAPAAFYRAWRARRTFYRQNAKHDTACRATKGWN